MAPTKRDLQERVSELEEALEHIHDLLDEALGIEEDEPGDNPEGEHQES